MNRSGTSNLIALCQKISVNARFDCPRLRGMISTNPEESAALQEAAAELERLALIARANDRYQKPKEEKKPMHPATQAILEEFEYAHLPENLQNASAPICHLAYAYAEMETTKGAELTTGLRKLLEAKDCLVRAARGCPARVHPINPRIINLNYVPDVPNTGAAEVHVYGNAPLPEGVAAGRTVIRHPMPASPQETAEGPDRCNNDPNPAANPSFTGAPDEILTALSLWAERHTANQTLDNASKNHFRRVATACNDLAYHITSGNVPSEIFDPQPTDDPGPPRFMPASNLPRTDDPGDRLIVKAS